MLSVGQSPNEKDLLILFNKYNDLVSELSQKSLEKASVFNGSALIAIAGAFVWAGADLGWLWSLCFSIGLILGVVSWEFYLRQMNRMRTAYFSAIDNVRKGKPSDEILNELANKHKKVDADLGRLDWLRWTPWLFFILGILVVVFSLPVI